MRSLVAGGGDSEITPDPRGAGVHHPGTFEATGAADVERAGDLRFATTSDGEAALRLGGEAALRLGGEAALRLEGDVATRFGGDVALRLGGDRLLLIFK